MPTSPETPDRATLAAWLLERAADEDRVIAAWSSSLIPAEHHNTRAKKLRQVADALAAMAWQPIETAPKDGTPILIDFGRIGIHRVFWSEAPFGPGIGSWCVTDIKFEDRPLRGYMHTDERGWMPLPDPPVAATAHPGADTGRTEDR